MMKGNSEISILTIQIFIKENDLYFFLDVNLVKDSSFDMFFKNFLEMTSKDSCSEACKLALNFNVLEIYSKLEKGVLT